MGRCCRERWQPWIVFRLWCCSHLGASGYLRSTPVLGGLGTCTSRAVTWMGYDGMVPGASATCPPHLPILPSKALRGSGFRDLGSAFWAECGGSFVPGNALQEMGMIGGEVSGVQRSSSTEKRRNGVWIEQMLCIFSSDQVSGFFVQK